MNTFWFLFAFSLSAMLACLFIMVIELRILKRLTAVDRWMRCHSNTAVTVVIVCTLVTHVWILVAGLIEVLAP